MSVGVRGAVHRGITPCALHPTPVPRAAVSTAEGIFAAYKTRSESSGPFGFGVCYHKYAERNGIDFEMSGRIDPSKNPNFFNGLTGEDFRCDRSA